MRPTFRKLEVKDIGNLEKLVAENVEGIEPGLKIVDSRLLLGHAAIDLVGLDTKGSLVLIALDFSADEGLLLRVMDAYSWCLEYPDTIRRLYPMAQVSASRPPRILFVVGRVTDAFLRRVKQLSVGAVDCIEFRHFEVNGASAVYFDVVERLRKSASGLLAAEAVAPSHPAPVATVTPASPAVAAAEPVAWSPAPLIMAAARVEPAVAPMPAPVLIPQVHAAPPEITAPPEIPAPAVASVAREALVLQFTPAAPEAEPAPKVEPPAAPALVLETPLNGAAHTSIEAAILEIAPPALFIGNEVTTVSAQEAVEQDPTPAPVSEPVVGTMPFEPMLEDVCPEPAVRVEGPVDAEPVALALASAQPVWAKPQGQGGNSRPYFFANASKVTTPGEASAAPAAVAPAIEQPAAPVALAVPAPAATPVSVAAPVAPAALVAPAAVPAPAAPSAAKPKVEVDPALESLSFPKDGLSRQWLEFLSQLGANK